jgi:hypothetical protein
VDSLTRPLVLTGKETLFLSDRLKNADFDEDVQGKIPVGKRLLLKIGSVFNELCTDKISSVEVTIYVTEAEAWVLREKLLTKDHLPDDLLFGIKFLNKIYEILLSFDAALEDVPVQEVVGDDYATKSKKYLYTDTEGETSNV